MQKEIISQKQGIFVMTQYILGSALVLGVGSEAKADIWLAILLAMVLAVPMYFVYARLLSLHPNKDLYEIAEATLGKAGGYVIAILYAWFSLHLGSLVLRNFTEFLQVVSLPETPQPAMGILMIILCIWGVKAGIEVLGRWCSLIFPIVMFAIIGVTFLTIPLIHLQNIKPVLYGGMKPVISSAFSMFSFPFAEVFLFTAALPLNNRGSVYKVFYWSLFAGGATILIVVLRNLLVMGPDLVAELYFPSYAVVRLINIGEFLQRIEVLVSVVFLLAGFTKATVCLHVSSKGIARIFRIQNFKQLTAPIGLLMMILSIVIYSDIMEMFEWATQIYKYYAFPFLVILPVLMLVMAEIKRLRAEKKEKCVQAA